jgi:hypothetical protein
MLQVVLMGQYSSSISSNAAAVAAAAAAATKTSAKYSSPQAQQQGAAVDKNQGSDFLLARQNLLQDLDAQYTAGLRPKYTWMVINTHDLLLDLMNGSYLWLKRTCDGIGCSSNDLDSSSGQDSSGPSNNDGSLGLDCKALYEVLLELPDGHQHRVASGAAAAALLAARWASVTAAKATDTGGCTQPMDSSNDNVNASASRSRTAVTGDGSSSSSCSTEDIIDTNGSSSSISTGGKSIGSSSSASGSSSSSSSIDSHTTTTSSSSRPLPLPGAMLRAERVAAALQAAGAAYLSREEAVRMAGMIGAWKPPSKLAEQQMAMPASTCC